MTDRPAWVLIALWGQIFGDVSPWVFVGPVIGGVVSSYWLRPRLDKSRERARRERERSSDG